MCNTLREHAIDYRLKRSRDVTEHCPQSYHISTSSSFSSCYPVFWLFFWHNFQTSPKVVNRCVVLVPSVSTIFPTHFANVVPQCQWSPELAQDVTTPSPGLGAAFEICGYLYCKSFSFRALLVKLGKLILQMTCCRNWHLFDNHKFIRSTLYHVINFLKRWMWISRYHCHYDI